MQHTSQHTLKWRLHSRAATNDETSVVRPRHDPRIIGRNLMRYALTERNLLSYIRHPFIVPWQGNPKKVAQQKKERRWWRRKMSDLFLGALQRFSRIFTLQNGEDYLATANLFRMGCFTINCWWVLPFDHGKSGDSQPKMAKGFHLLIRDGSFFKFFGVFFWPKIRTQNELDWSKELQRISNPKGTRSTWAMKKTLVGWAI